VHVVRVDPQRLVHAPHPHLPPLRRRLRLCRLPREAVQRLAAALPWYEPTTRPSTGLAPGPRPAAPPAPGRRGDLYLLTHAWVARAVRLPAVLVVQRARLRDVCTRRSPAAPARPPPPAPRAGAAARAVPRGTARWHARWPLRASSRPSWCTAAAGVARPPPALACRRAWGRGHN